MFLAAIKAGINTVKMLDFIVFNHILVVQNHVNDMSTRNLAKCLNSHLQPLLTLERLLNDKGYLWAMRKVKQVGHDFL